MRINLTDEQIDNIVRLRTIEKMGIRRIAELVGVSYEVVKRRLDERGIATTSVQAVNFTEAEKDAIVAAYRDGVGVNGIPGHLGFGCTAVPIKRVLGERGEQIRGRSEQQAARMSRASPEEISRLTKRAHDAVRGRVASMDELRLRAKSREGKINKRSKFEDVVFEVLSDNFSDVAPAKAIERYNIDFGVGESVAVEVFGGGWSISDRDRIAKYIHRTKQIGEFGLHTVFIVFVGVDLERFSWDEFIRTVDVARRDPSSESKYWVVWGDAKGASGLSSDIDRSAFVCPFVNVRDSATGRYKRVAR